MKGKNSKGITLIALVITVIVLLIIATISINYGMEIAQKSNIESIKTNMLLIEAKSKLYAEEYNFSGDANSLYGTVASSVTDETVQNFISGVGSSYASYYYLSLQDLSEMGLSINKGYYLVNYDINNFEVVYVTGVELEGNVYYTLTDIRGL